MTWRELLASQQAAVKDLAKAQRECDELRQQVATLRLISNANGDWSMKYANVCESRNAALATAARVRALIDAAPTHLMTPLIIAISDVVWEEGT
jgi:hypothetical protein